MIVFNIISIACISFLFIAAEPIILLKRFMGFKEEMYLEYSKAKQFFYRMITCCLCSGFWIGLILTLSISQASIIAVIAELIYKINNRI